MPLNDPFSVMVRVFPGDPLGDAMNRIRAWLDSQKIQTASFTRASDAWGYALTIGFKSIAEASRFRLEFAGHLDSVPAPGTSANRRLSNDLFDFDGVGR